MKNQLIDIQSVELQDSGKQLGFDDGRLTINTLPDGFVEWGVYLAGAGHPQIVETGEEHSVLIITTDGEQYQGDVLVGYTNTSEYGDTCVLEGNGELKKQ